MLLLRASSAVQGTHGPVAKHCCLAVECLAGVAVHGSGHVCLKGSQQLLVRHAEGEGGVGSVVGHLPDLRSEAHGGHLHVVLVVRHLLQNHVGGDGGGDVGGQAHVQDVAVVVLQALLVAVASRVGDLSAHAHADGHGLTVQQGLVRVRPGDALHGVPHAVSVLGTHLVEVGLAVVVQRGHLDLDAHLADVLDVLGVVEGGLAKLAHGVADGVDQLQGLAQTMLEGLSNTVANVAHGEAAAALGVDDDLFCGVVAAQQVLA
mmetsp:Transcript_5845/g.12890  ORF Transcript_5845/g.12890 Transcript_5845/m.12890 type:complete len:261 (-) Transcript_5845:1196-1978(-)